MKASSTDWPALRADFPILQESVNGHPLIYFDNAATSQKPRVVIDAIRNYYEHSNANVHRGIHELSNRATDAYESARARTAKFLNARDPAEIIFTRGTTEGINLVAIGLDRRPIRYVAKSHACGNVIGRSWRLPRLRPRSE